MREKLSKVNKNNSKGMQSGRETTQFKKLKWVVQQRKPGHPTKRWGHTTVVHDGRLLVFGGDHSGINREGVYKVDCQSLQGDALNLAVQPQMRESHSCTLYHDCLYIYGGCIDKQVKLAGSNPSWRKLEQRNPIPPRESHIAVLIHKKYILIYGGSSPDEKLLDQFWLLDLQTLSWQQVKQIKGKLEARIGATMTPFENQIYSFGGQWSSEDQSSQFTNDISKLRFEGEIKGQSIPPLSITKLQVSGPKPNARTGHSAVDYKGKVLIIIGGQGHKSKKTSVLYNDIWAFDIRTSVWTELVVENRNSFRPRANFTANIYKNTIFIFGGFVNISKFIGTDQLITVVLTEVKPPGRQQAQNRSNTLIQPKPNVTLLRCLLCKFEYIPQERQAPILPERHIQNPNLLIASTHNIIQAARLISSPFDGLGLVINALSLMAPSTQKQIQIDLIGQKLATQNKQISAPPCNQHLRFKAKHLNLTKAELQNLVSSYRCEPNDPGFDLKNGLFRLGKEVLICQLFQDGMLHGYILSSEGIQTSVLRLQNIAEQLQKRENKALCFFVQHFRIDLDDIQTFGLYCFVADLNRDKDDQLELKTIQNDFTFKKSQKNMSFKQYIKDYFLGEKNVTLRVNGEQTPLLSYENLLRNPQAHREQQPTTKYFSKVHLIINESEQIITQSSSFVQIFALGRRVGVYNKYPFISGFLELCDISSLNFPRTRCDNWQIKAALEEEIQSLIEQSHKRESEVPLAQLQREHLD